MSSKLEKLEEKIANGEKILKICGIREHLESYKGIDMIGLNFVTTSKRKISLEVAKKIKTDACLIGLFQNQEFEFIKNYIELLNLDMVQLHGNETNEFCQQIKKLGVGVIKAIKATESQKALDYNVDYIIYDNVKGGLGESYDYMILKDIKTPYLVAGGVEQSNIQTIFSQLPNAIGVDIASGAETKGVLDENKIKAMVKEVENYNSIKKSLKTEV